MGAAARASSIAPGSALSTPGCRAASRKAASGSAAVSCSARRRWIAASRRSGSGSVVIAYTNKVVAHRDAVAADTPTWAELDMGLNQVGRVLKRYF